jgi:hypothetical protein
VWVSYILLGSILVYFVFISLVHNKWYQRNFLVQRRGEVFSLFADWF